MSIPAKYEKGVFRPLVDHVNLKEGTLVEVFSAKIVEGLSVGIEAAPAGKRRLKDLPAYGMWKDREDMADSVAYINRLRGNLRGE